MLSLRLLRHYDHHPLKSIASISHAPTQPRLRCIICILHHICLRDPRSPPTTAPYHVYMPYNCMCIFTLLECWVRRRNICQGQFDQALTRDQVFDTFACPSLL